MLVEISDPTPENKNVESTPVPLNHIGLITADLVATVEKVRAAGYPVTVEPRPMSGSGSLSFVKGPNGESIEFMQLD